MGHLLNAIIARGPIAEAKAVERGLPVIFEGDFVIVPIHWDVLMELSRDDEPADGSAMNMFNTHVPHLLASELGMDPYVLIETCYHGGIGEQHASFHRADGYELRNVSINTALRALGVNRTPPYQDPLPKEAGPDLWDRLENWWKGRRYMSPRERSNLYPVMDEFDTLGLGRYRSMDSSEFWEEGKSGQRIGNILVGDRRRIKH